MSFERFVTFRFPEEVFQRVKRTRRDEFMPTFGAFNRSGNVHDPETNQRVSYFEFVSDEEKAQYLKDLEPELASYIASDVDLESLVGAE